MYVYMYICIYLLIHSSHDDAVSSSKLHTVFTQMQDQVFFIKFGT